MWQTLSDVNYDDCVKCLKLSAFMIFGECAKCVKFSNFLIFGKCA